MECHPIMLRSPLSRSQSTLRRRIHRWLWACSALPALTLGSLGCFGKADMPVAPPNPVMEMDNHKEDDLPKRKPHAATCVAFALVREQCANDPKSTPAQQEILREEARKAYQQALQIDPTHLPAQLGMARLYIAMGNRERGLEIYQAAIKQHPKDASVWSELGLYYARVKQWDAALDHLKSAHELEPDNAKYAKSYAFCLSRAGRYDDAFVVFRRTAGEPMAYYYMARMLHHVQQDARSEKFAEKALELKADLVPAQELLAELRGQTPPANVPTALAPAAVAASNPPADVPHTAIAVGFEE